MYLTFEDIIQKALEPMSCILPSQSIEEAKTASDIWHIQSIDEKQQAWDNMLPNKFLEKGLTANYSILPIQYIEEAQNTSDIWPIQSIEEEQLGSDMWSTQTILKQQQTSDSIPTIPSVVEAQTTSEIWSIPFIEDEQHTSCNIFPIQSIQEAQNAGDIWPINKSIEKDQQTSYAMVPIQSKDKTQFESNSILSPLSIIDDRKHTSVMNLPTKSTERPQKASDSILRIKSKDKYFKAYETFIQWKKNRKENSFSENVFLEYFYERSKRSKPTSLWSTYTMLRSAMMFKNGIDIKKYYTLLKFLKLQSYGYKPKKTKVLTATDVEHFLNHAPDKKYLATKIALMFGVTGGCGRADLASLTTKDIETHGDSILVTIRNSKTQNPRTFSIYGAFCSMVKKYQSIRSSTGCNRFFQNYRNGKCTAQNIGVNKFGVMPKEIALYLNLPEPELYTGHSFKSTSAALRPL